MAKSMRIKTDDQVIVISGKDAGKTGRVVRTDPKKRRVYVEGLNMIKRHERPRSPGRPEKRPGRRHRREGGADRRLQRDAARPQRQQADPGRRAPRRRRQARPVREAQRGGDRLMEATATRLAGSSAAAPARALRAGDAAGADREIRLLDADAGAAADQDHPQHGPRHRETGQKVLRIGPGTAGADRRPAPERAPRPQVDRLLQAARGDAGRRLGDAAAGPHVGVPRPPDLDRGAAHPRLPRPQPALLRRPRQLLDGRQRAADLPRNRLRLGRRRARSRHHDHDLGRRPISRLSSCCSDWACRSPRRGVPARRSAKPPKPRPRRSSAKRRPAARPRSSRPRSSS